MFLGPRSESEEMRQTNGTDTNQIQNSQSRNRFTNDEDELILRLVVQYGDENWTEIARHVLNRSSRQCRERYRQHLDPSLKRGDWSDHEDVQLMRLFKRHGSNWNKISAEMGCRSRVSIRNRYFAIRRIESRQATDPTEERKAKEIQTLYEELVRPAASEGFSEMRFYAEFGF